MAELLLILTVVAPIAWFASEFQSRAWLRILLGLGALVGIFLAGSLWSFVNELEANSYFGRANDEFIDATLEALEGGRAANVLEGLREFRRAYSPTYENRAQYEELVEAYSRRLGADPMDAKSLPNAQ